MDRIFFPEKAAQISDRPALTLIIMGPNQSVQETPEVPRQIEAMTREYGQSARTYRARCCGWCPILEGHLRDRGPQTAGLGGHPDEGLPLDEAQQKQLDTNIKKARRDLTESVWRTYKHVMLLGKDNTIKTIDLGLVTSSAAETMTKLILSRLRQSGEVEREVSPRFLVRNWPPAFTAWSTKAVRDAFYASPAVPAPSLS